MWDEEFQQYYEPLTAIIAGGPLRSGRVATREIYEELARRDPAIRDIFAWPDTPTIIRLTSQRRADYRDIFDANGNMIDSGVQYPRIPEPELPMHWPARVYHQQALESRHQARARCDQAAYGALHARASPHPYDVARPAARSQRHASRPRYDDTSNNPVVQPFLPIAEERSMPAQHGPEGMGPYARALTERWNNPASANLGPARPIAPAQPAQPAQPARSAQYPRQERLTPKPPQRRSRSPARPPLETPGDNDFEARFERRFYPIDESRSMLAQHWRRADPRRSPGPEEDAEGGYGDRRRA